MDLPISFGSWVSLRLGLQHCGFCFTYEFSKCQSKAAAISQGGERGHEEKGKERTRRWPRWDHQ